MRQRDNVIRLDFSTYIAKYANYIRVPNLLRDTKKRLQEYEINVSFA